MKKYKDFLFENEDIYLQIDNKYKELYHSIRLFVIKNVLTTRSIEFSRDEDNELLKKRNSSKFKKYYNQIDNIFKERFEKNIDNLDKFMQSPEYKIYHNMIQEILNKKQPSTSNQPNIQSVQAK